MSKGNQRERKIRFFVGNLPKLPKNVFPAEEQERLIVFAEVTRAMYANNAQKVVISRKRPIPRVVCSLVAIDCEGEAQTVCNS